MQVLGELVRLPDNNALPIPWWHRAPLGLQSGTWCYVALVKSNHRPVPDLIISVLDPSKWTSLRRIRCLHRDEPGVISKAVAAVRDFNIALAESATLRSGELHEVTLFCEELSGQQKPPSNAKIAKRLRDSDFHTISSDRFGELQVIWQQLAEINAGWIQGVPWRDMIVEHTSGPVSETIDLARAVVSADTTNRFARFVFPHANARTILIEHLDEPGVLQQLTNVLVDNKLNLLSMLLRRGGAKPHNAVLVAVCEPHTDAKEALNNIRDQLKKLPPRLMIKMRSHDGVIAEKTITSREPNTVVARVPAGLVEKVRRTRSSVPANTPAVFFSHRFVSHPRAATLSDHVRKAVANNNCHLLEASPDDDIRGPNLVYDDVSAKMWAADAGIVLVADIGDDDPMGKNLPHEIGFMLGQGKPLLLLIDSKLDGNGKRPLGSNLDGVFAPRFPADEIAFATDHQNSIVGIIRKWVQQVRTRI